MRAEFWGFEAASPRGYATEMEIPDTDYDEDDVHARGMGGATPGVSCTPSLVTCDQSTIGRVCSSGVLNDDRGVERRRFVEERAVAKGTIWG